MGSSRAFMIPYSTRNLQDRAWPAPRPCSTYTPERGSGSGRAGSNRARSGFIYFSAQERESYLHLSRFRCSLLHFQHMDISLVEFNWSMKSTHPQSSTFHCKTWSSATPVYGPSPFWLKARLLGPKFLGTRTTLEAWRQSRAPRMGSCFSGDSDGVMGGERRRGERGGKSKYIVTGHDDRTTAYPTRKPKKKRRRRRFLRHFGHLKIASKKKASMVIIIESTKHHPPRTIAPPPPLPSSRRRRRD